MSLRLPAPLRPGDRIGVTSPSSGVPAKLRPRLEYAVGWLRERGYDVVVGECMDGESHVSAPKHERAAELTAMLADPEIRAVVPPWGGVTAIDILDRLGWDELADADPTWVVGYSDTTTWMLPLTLELGWATLHGTNLMDTPYAPPDGLSHWIDVAAATGPLTQRAIGRHRTAAFDDWESDPQVLTLDLDATGQWLLLDPSTGAVDVTGRLVGGCIDVLGPLAGTAYGDVAAFGAEHADTGLVVYLEACDDEAFTICRLLHAMRYAGWFDHARAVLVGRTLAPASDTMTQHEAVRDALGDLDVPVVLDVECGHVAPFMPLVNGAPAHLVVDGERREITQDLRR
jgi:muramoyltetrapeptide carboxypeptidase